MRRYAALVLFLLVTVAAHPQCDRRGAFNACADLDVTVAPGDCAEISIDCDTDWAQLGAFSVRDTFAGLWVEVERRPGANKVRLCTDTSMPAVVGQGIEYVHVRTDGEVFVGIIRLNTVVPLVAVATADPPVVVSGGTSQLGVDVSGGRPPYAFSWGFSDAFIGPYDVRDPVVKPAQGEIFGVVVRDAADNRRTASVLVDVVPVTTTVAIPDTIDAGQPVGLFFGATPAQLVTTVLGWTWTPDLPSGEPVSLTTTSTTAAPVVTTTYTYSFRTFYGTLVADSVTVHVRQ